MSDEIPLPPRPNLEHYKKLAKSYLKTDPKFAKLSDAQFSIACAHGFASWPKFAKHIHALQSANSPDAMFERAADAVFTGDIATLTRLLTQDPELIRRRSNREHRSTLLHYVSANGIEDFRQKTPRNILEITTLLLDAGADVNAESDAYAGRSTALYLASTSVHPRDASLQLPLLGLLLARGASIEHKPGEAVRGCIANGCPEAAEFLAARIDKPEITGAALLGQLDVVRSLMTEATKEQIERAFQYACEFGRDNVVEFLIDSGVDLNAGAHTDMTGMHWAAHEGHLSTVNLLLTHNAPIEAMSRYGGTVLGGTVWAAIHHPRPDHLRIIETLIDAGAKVGDDWFTGRAEIDEALQRGRMRNAKRARFDRPEESRRLYAQSVAVYRRGGRSRELVEALKGLGQIERDAGRSDAALALYEEAAEICRGLGDPLLLAHTIRHVADIHYDAGRRDRAEPLFAEALAFYRNHDTPPLDLANAVGHFAILKDELGDIEQAQRLYEEAYRLYVATNVRAGVAETATRLARLFERRHDVDRAREWRLRVP